MGVRPAAGVGLQLNADGREILVGGNEASREKVRPMKQWSQVNSDYKSHANKAPKPNASHTCYESCVASNRLIRKVDAIIESNDYAASPLSKSLLELLPQYANNTDSSVQTTLSHDAGILYSFDNKGPSPSLKGRAVDLGGLVDLAEKRWVSEQTDRIVKGEYEVLDADGEMTVLPSAKGKKRGSPKQKAAKNMPVVEQDMGVEEDDGFELI